MLKRSSLTARVDVPPPPLPSKGPFSPPPCEDYIPPPPMPPDCSEVPPPPQPPPPEFGSPPPPSEGAGAEGSAPAPAAPIDVREQAFRQAADAVLAEMSAAVQGFEVGREAEFVEAIAAAKSGLARAVDEFVAAEVERIASENKAKDRARYRQKLIDELSATEDDYLNDLLAIENVWHAEIRRSGLLSPADLQVLFGNVAQLVVLSQDIAAQLQKSKSLPIESQRLGEDFKRKIPFIRLYIEYCYNQVKGSEILSASMKSSKFKDLIEKIQSNHASLKNLDLGAFLIKPTQRITKYPLFLRDLVRLTNTDHPDYKNLCEAADAMNKVLQDINKRTRELETIAVINKIVPYMSWRSDPHVDLVLSASQLHMEGKVTSCVVDHADSDTDKGNRVLLFNNVLLVCRSASKESWSELVSIPTASLQLRQPLQPGILVLTSVQAAVEVTLLFQSEQERKAWLAGIQEAIKDALEAPPLQLVEGGPSVRSKKERRDSDGDLKRFRSRTLRSDRDRLSGPAASPVVVRSSQAAADFLCEQPVSPSSSSPQLMIPIGRKRAPSEADLLSVFAAPPALSSPTVLAGGSPSVSPVLLLGSPVGVRSAASGVRGSGGGMSAMKPPPLVRPPSTGGAPGSALDIAPPPPPPVDIPPPPM
eukprot:m51a1_g11011 putative domain containing protein (647) ;mRNA; f:375069-377387